MKKIEIVFLVLFTSISLFAQPNINRKNANNMQRREMKSCKIDKCANFEKMMKFYDTESFTAEQKKQMESLVKLYTQHSEKIVNEIQSVKKELETLMNKAIVDDKAFESIINDIDSLVVKKRRLSTSFRTVSSLFVDENQIVRPQRNNIHQNFKNDRSQGGIDGRQGGKGTHQGRIGNK